MNDCVQLTLGKTWSGKRNIYQPFIWGNCYDECRLKVVKAFDSGKQRYQYRSVVINHELLCIT